MGKDELRGLSKNDLVRLVLRLHEENVTLKERLDAIEKSVARSRKDSSTSSKPPSSDIVKPPKPKPRKSGGKKRKLGGQPGHERHERQLLLPEQLDAEYEYSLDCCDACQGPLQGASRAPDVFEHVELVGRSFRISQHRLPWFWCQRCRTHQRGTRPAELKSGLFGPRMSAFVAYLKGAGHMSYVGIQALLRDVFGVCVSTGYLTKVVVQKVGAALASPYTELVGALRGEPWLNVDETGHKDSGQKYWNWCFRAADYSVFHIDPSRGSCVLEGVLGKAFGGVLGSDYYSAYRKYMGDDVLVQFCVAHLIRDVRYLTTLPDRVTRNYGERVLTALKALFKVYHRREKMSAERFAKQMERAKQVLITKAKAAPMRSEAQNIAKRFRKHGASYFRFITTPGVEPTNNLAEQAIRHAVIDRRITQGTRGAAGQRWCERIWTTLATCAQQGRSAFEFISQAVHAQIRGLPPPSLLPG